MLNLRLLSPERLIDVSRLERAQVHSCGRQRASDRCADDAQHSAGSRRTLRCAVRSWQKRTGTCRITRCAIGEPSAAACAITTPAAEMPLVVNLLGASLVGAKQNGERHHCCADQFFRGSFETVLEDDELLTEIRVPIPANGHGWSFQEVSQRKGDFALAATAAMLTLENGTCRNVRLGFRNVGERVSRLKAVEAQIEGQTPTERLFSAAASAAMKAVEPPSDLHADADYRRDLVKALTERVLNKAVERARS